jgi:hypothetical protein
MTLHDHVDRADVDTGALLVALVLVPHSYPRNRFYDMYRRPGAARTRRRAAMLRSLIADMLSDADDAVLRRDGQRHLLSYSLPELGATRSTLLDDDELALIVLAAARHEGCLPACFDTVDATALSRVRRRLERLFR